MTQAPAQAECAPLSPQLQERLAALGVTVVLIEAGGRLLPVGKCRWFERHLVESALFGAAVERAMPRLRVAGEVGVEVWPGARVVLLPLAQRRASERSERHAALGVLLTGPALLESEQLRALCDASRLDFAATVARVDRASLVSDAEASRLAPLLAWLRRDALELDRCNREIQGLSRQLGESYEELSLLYKLSDGMNVGQPPSRFLTMACRELQQVLGLKWMALQLTDREPRLNALAGQLFVATSAATDGALLGAVGRRLLDAQPAHPAPQVIDDTSVLGVPQLDGLASQMILIPLVDGERAFGILFGGDKLDASQITTVDTQLCGSLAASLSIFLQNTMFYEDMQAMFMGTLHALTSSIDAKDAYTHGHSERVALLSRQLAAAAGLPAKTVERVYISGLVHDVGKIGVPEAVLSKPGSLTEEEFALIKLHPQIGARILHDIRQMQDLIPGVLGHHERWDGRGYPSRLCGESIPLFGRLICLADSFDAMSSNRTYRQAMRLEQVLAEITRCAGKQFDPALAELFVKLDFQPVSELVLKHQQLHEARRRETTRSATT